MDEYANNWDLHAVVRGCIPDTCSLDPFHDFYPGDHSFSINEEEESGDYSLFFPDFAATENVFPELEELYKPFVARREQQNSQVPDHRPVTSSAPRSKRRKNQQKKVVCQVPAEDGLCSDVWAWRKYGQKPIKGSPFPRGYYRCSTSKGCSAKRQVERSRTDPTMLIITYTGEHNHSVPIHRNSLAGSTRTKFPPPPSSKDEGEQNLNMDLDLDSDDKTSNTKFGSSPTTPLNGSMEADEILMLKDDHEVDVMNKNDHVEDEDFVNNFLCSMWQVENSAIGGSGCS